ncbi:hypothetical protein Tco_0988644 [Tanacetum coccineum]|uniref:Uncharacterized protein n=1 Tax=Tanacetum coccineum TaxID=301880 RepID=A0ABQ5ERI9_9ASTR
MVPYLPWSEGAIFGMSRLSGQLMTSSRAMVQYLPWSDGAIFDRSRLSGQLRSDGNMHPSFRVDTNCQGEDTSRCLGKLATLEEFLNKSLEVLLEKS